MKLGAEKILHYQVTARDIRRFAQAIGIPEPTPQPDGELVAPPLFCQTFMFEDVAVDQLPADGSPIELDAPLPPTRAMGGASDFEVCGTVRSGDTLTVRSVCKDLVAKHGKSGALYLVVVETTFHNQRSELVARETATYVKKPVP